MAQTARERLGSEARQLRSPADRDAVALDVARRLQQPLSADDAVQIALLNNPGLRATYADLDIAQADLVQASRLTNPRWTYLHAVNGSSATIESIFAAEVLQLLTLPLRSRIEGRRFERTKLTVADAMLKLAFEARKAQVEAVAAEQSVVYLRQVLEAAEAGAELGRRMAEAGNWSKLNQMREQAFHADATSQLRVALQGARMTREKLVRVLGLPDEGSTLMLPPRLPELPTTVPAFGNLESRAIAERLDIRLAKAELDGLQDSLGLSRVTRLVDVLEVGPARVRESPEPVRRGYELTLSIPVFDWGESRVAKAEATYAQAIDKLARIAVDARSEVRQAHDGYLAALEQAKYHRDHVVPLRKRIADETLLRYNGMLASVFELLAEAREQVRAVNASMAAAREFWLADAELRHALGGGLPPTVTGGMPASQSPPATTSDAHAAGNPSLSRQER